jgi:hypothetical protein
MEEDEPLYYRLIKAFFKLTGVPMVLNTSFNTIKSEVRPHFTCFTGTKVQIMALEKEACTADSGDPRRCRAVVSACAVYLLYWYNSTNTDAREACSRLRRPPQMPCGRFCMRAAQSGYSVYLL